MNIRAATVCVTFCAMALSAGCAEQGEEAPEPPGTNLIPASGSETLSRPGYTVGVPQDWLAREGFTEWDPGTSPFCGSPPFDTLTSPDGDPCTLIGRQQLPKDSSLDDWVATLRETDTVTYPTLCLPPRGPSEATVAGEAARTYVLRCPEVSRDAIAVHVFAANGRWGYLFMCYSEANAKAQISALERSCRAWLGSVRFND